MGGHIRPALHPTGDQQTGGVPPADLPRASVSAAATPGGMGRLDHRLAPTPAFRGTHLTSWSSRRHGSPSRRPHPWGRHDHESGLGAVPDPGRKPAAHEPRPPAHSTRTPRPSPVGTGPSGQNYRTPWSPWRPSPTRWHASSRPGRRCWVLLDRRWSRCRPRRVDIGCSRWDQLQVGGVGGMCAAQVGPSWERRCHGARVRACGAGVRSAGGGFQGRTGVIIGSVRGRPYPAGRALNRRSPDGGAPGPGFARSHLHDPRFRLAVAVRGAAANRYSGSSPARGPVSGVHGRGGSRGHPKLEITDPRDTDQRHGHDLPQ